MFQLFSFPIVIEPDIQRLSGFLLECFKKLDAPLFRSSAKIPALNQHLREELENGQKAFETKLFFDQDALFLGFKDKKFPLALKLKVKEDKLLKELKLEFKNKINTSDPELLKLHNIAIKKQLAKAQKKAKEEIDKIEAQLVRHKKELNIYMEKAETDSLTGLYNRRAYDRLMSEYFLSLKEEPFAFSLIFLDLDHFKVINDNFGHAYGDEVLRSMALAMRFAIREGQDKACRIGGDEFAILLNADYRQAIRISQNILSDMDNKMSIGIAVWQEEDSPESLAHKADKALYHAKENGRGCIALISSSEKREKIEVVS